MKSSRNTHIPYMGLSSYLGPVVGGRRGGDIGPAGGIWILAPWGGRTLRGEGGD